MHHPRKEVLEYQIPHGVSDDGGFRAASGCRDLDGGFQAGKILISNFEVGEGEAPIGSVYGAGPQGSKVEGCVGVGCCRLSLARVSYMSSQLLRTQIVV